ncbi:MAG: DedA family protein [Candidatus Nanopelagicales bacterium]
MVLDPDLAALSAVAVCAVIWGFIFAECGLLLGLLLPGDTILFAGGLLAGAPDSELSLPLLVTGTFLAAVLGNEVGYVTGRRYGRAWIEARERGRMLEQLRRTERFYERWGWIAVVVARWIPWVRTLTPLVAGAARMDRRAFTSANIVGALPWAVGLPVLGYFAYQLPVLRQVSYAVAAISIIGSAIAAFVILRRDRRARAERAAADPTAADPAGAEGSATEPAATEPAADEPAADDGDAAPADRSG